MFVDNKAFKAFLAQFMFRPEYRGCIGIERERFLVDGSGRSMPRAKEFLERIGDDRWTYELSACQVEDRVGPAFLMDGLENELNANDMAGNEVARSMGLELLAMDVAPADMPLEVYPDPRYRCIAAEIKRKRLLAACRVAGTHIHIGIGSMEEALNVYGVLRMHFREFCRMGDHSKGERLRFYKEMAVNWEPQEFKSAEEFFVAAIAHGFAHNPRNCWHLMRISKHGTVELRMFGAAISVGEILEWVSCVRDILGKEVLLCL